MEHGIASKSLRNLDRARLRQDAYFQRARTASKWMRRGVCLTLVMGGIGAWQDPTFGPMIENAVVTAAHSADVYLGGDGNARDIVTAALSDIRG